MPNRLYRRTQFPNSSGIPSAWLPVTPDNDNDNVGDACIAIRVTTAGTISFICAGAPDTIVDMTVTAGEVISGYFTRIREQDSGGTDITATGIHAGQG